MIKAEMNKGYIKRLEVTGNLIDICAESVLLLDTIKESLEKENEALGHAYMCTVKRSIDYCFMDDAKKKDYKNDARERVQTLITGIEKILEMFPKEG